MSALAALVERCEALYEDLALGAVGEWKARTGGKAMGYMPVYFPREILHAAGILPVGIMGGADLVEIIKGDAYFQSYICHIPRSTVELGLAGKLDHLDGMIFPSICDVIRNLSGMWQLLFPDKLSLYFDLPQNFAEETGGTFHTHDLETLGRRFAALSGVEPTAARLCEAISLYNENRRLVRALYRRRSEAPWQVPTVELYLLLRAGLVLEVAEHNALMARYLRLAGEAQRQPLDNSRVVIVGSFCEQPPLGLIRALERSGCYIVDDDYVLVTRWLRGDVPQEGEPLSALARAYLRDSREGAFKYMPEGKGEDLRRSVAENRADGVIFAAPSFCDPALLDRPMLQAHLDRHGIPHTAFKYAENTGQFQVIREQAGTFADSLKLMEA